MESSSHPHRWSMTYFVLDLVESCGMLGRHLIIKDGGLHGAYFKQMNSFSSPSRRRRSYDDFTMPRNACIHGEVKRKNSFSRGKLV